MTVTQRLLTSVLVSHLTALSALAATWNFNITTTGQDIAFVAPAALPTNWPAYKMRYEVTEMNAQAILVGFPGFVVTVPVLDRLPPELRLGQETLAGPPPLVLLEGDARYPEDANLPAGFQSRITFGMNDSGRAYVSSTQNILSIFETQIDPNVPVTVTVELLSVQLVGTLSAEEGVAVLADQPTIQISDGGSATVRVRLSTAPAENVTLTITPAADGDPDLAATEASVTFTPDNWNTDRVITFTAARDDDTVAGQSAFVLESPDVIGLTISAVEVEFGADCNQNGVEDPAEIATGETADCNANGIPDSCELALGAARDCNGDGVPDACQADRDADGLIDACDGCPDDRSKSTPGTCGCGVSDTPNCGVQTPTPTAPDDSQAGSPQPDDNSASDPNDGAADPNSNTDPNTPSLDDSPDFNDLESLLLNECGSGLCGVGTLTWLPLTVLGLAGMRRRRAG